MKKRLKKLKVVLHPLFFVFGIIMIVVGRGRAFFICTLSAFCHELAHSKVADKYGYKMERIRLMPFGAELHGDTDSFVGRDEIYIALAGPMLNFLICVFILGIWWLFPGSYDSTIEIFETNLVMGTFNLLPFFPLDGGRVLLSIVSMKTSRRTGAKIVKNTTKLFAITLFIGFILTCFFEPNLTLGVMGFMLFFSATASQREAVYEKLSLVELVKTKKVRWVTMSIPEDTAIYEVRRMHSKNQIAIFKVISKDGREIFSFNELDLERILASINQDLLVKDLKNKLY